MRSVRGYTISLLFLFSLGGCAPVLAERSSPENLEACFAALDSLLEKSDIDSLRTGTEQDVWRYHHGLGMWLRNEWGLLSGSQLQRWFNARKVYHPDDMSGIILISYWRYLNDRPIGLQEQIDYYVAYWARVATPVDPRCPTCNRELRASVRGEGLDMEHDTAYVHVYHCPRGHYFFYQSNRGFYVPTSEAGRARLDSVFLDWKAAHGQAFQWDEN